MANVYKENVWVVDTDGAFPFDLAQVCKVKIIGGSDATSLSLKVGGVSGTVVYQTAVAASTEKLEEVFIRSKDGLYADIGGTGAKAYIYLR